MKNIGFIGIGVMGASMARNLLNKGFSVAVYTRTKEKAESLLSEGAVWCDSVKDCAAGRDAVITMVGFPADVEEVYFGPNGVIANADPGTILIDMTTTDPRLAERIARQAEEKGMAALDAPVSGGDSGAKAGTLSIMAGGSREAFETCGEIFSAMGTSIQYAGGPGKGQHTKMANQIALGGALAGVCEALAYGEANGLNLQTMLDSISKGAAGSWQMTNMAPRMLAGDFEPGFYIKHYIKDLTLAVQSAEEKGCSLEILNTVLRMFRSLADWGMEDMGTQALLHYYNPEESEQYDPSGL